MRAGLAAEHAYAYSQLKGWVGCMEPWPAQLAGLSKLARTTHTGYLCCSRQRASGPKRGVETGPHAGGAARKRVGAKMHSSGQPSLTPVLLLAISSLRL